MLRKKMIAGLAVPLAAASIGLASAGTADAINRVPCGRSDFLSIYSNSSTCWANSGTVSVRLYNVQGWSSGNNAGYLRTISGATSYYSKYRQYNYTSLQTVTVVHIN